MRVIGWDGQPDRSNAARMDSGECVLIEVSLVLYRKCRPTSRRPGSTVAMSLPVTDVLGNIVNTPEVVVSLVVCTTTGRSLRFDFME